MTKELIVNQLIKNWNVIIGKTAVPQWKRWLGIMIALWLLSIVFIIIWPIKTGNANNPETLYLLSALAQSLAAIFALIFTITLVVAQLTSRYSHRIISRFFDPYVMLYISIFLASILLSILVLNNPIPFLVKLSIIMGAFSLYLLIPFFLRIKEQLNPYHIIDTLRLEADAKLNQNPGIEPEEIITIDNFIMSSFVLKDYDTYGLGIKTLTELVVKHIKATHNREDNQSRSFITSTIQKISEVGLVTIEDPRAPFKVIDSLIQITDTDIQQKLDLFTSYACNGLSRIGESAARNGIIQILKDDFSNNIPSRLFFVCESGIRNKMESTTIAAGFALGSIGVELAKNKIDDITTVIAGHLQVIILDAIRFDFDLTDSGISICSSLTCQLGNIGNEAIRNGLQNSAGWIATFLSNIGENALDKNLHDTSKEAANSLGAMGRPACEISLVVALESITRCLYDIGKASIERIDQPTFQTIAEYLNIIIVEGNKNGLDHIVTKSAKYLYKLGTLATINQHGSFQEVILKNIEPLHNKLGFVDIGYQQVRNEFTNMDDNLKAFEEFTLLLKT